MYVVAAVLYAVLGQYGRVGWVLGPMTAAVRKPGAAVAERCAKRKKTHTGTDTRKMAYLKQIS
jgi:hypothetical protein